MIESLNRLNELLTVEAEAEFLKCCGSKRWAEAMTAARPFSSAQAIFDEANSLFGLLSEHDWLEAFHAHPKIGEKKTASAQSQQAQDWSKQEQSGTANAQADTMSALAARNRVYEERFGFIFIVCATGKSSEEMLAILNDRLTNSTEKELQIAAGEQRKITRLRLEKLLNQ